MICLSVVIRRDPVSLSSPKAIPDTGADADADADADAGALALALALALAVVVAVAVAVHADLTMPPTPALKEPGVS